MDTLLIFFLNRSFLDKVEKKIKNRFFKIRESVLFLYIILNGAQNFKFIGSIYTTHDWLNFIHFSGYKYKIRLVSIKGQREDQALISISTILKFSALDTHFKILKKKKATVSRKNLKFFFLLCTGWMWNNSWMGRKVWKVWQLLRTRVLFHSSEYLLPWASQALWEILVLGKQDSWA